MKKGEGARPPEVPKGDPEEEPAGELRQTEMPPSDPQDPFEREMLERLRQERSMRKNFFFLELALLPSSFIICVVMVAAAHSVPLRLGAAAALWYIVRQIIKHMTNKF
jgi:hypothetical protein